MHGKLPNVANNNVLASSSSGAASNVPVTSETTGPSSDIASVDSVPAVMASASAVLDTAPPAALIQLGHRRCLFANFLWMALQYLISKGGAAVTSPEVRDLGSLVPPPLSPARTVAILLNTLQNLAVNQGPLCIFRE